ncbi:kelch repeat protein [Gigaspora margarita]|nr:kelch repeat protein [Gigaspora margarita]
MSDLYSSNEVWYLDLSIPFFNAKSPLWHKGVGMPIGYDSGTSCVSPIDNSSIFLIGGEMFVPNTNTPNFTSTVYIFNSTTSQWSMHNIISFNSSFTTRKEMQAIVDNNGKIFIFGGSSYDTINTIFYGDMNILDINTMTWSTPAQDFLIHTYVDYSATLLANGNIVYIGGRYGSNSSVSSASMNQIQVFDTKNDSWSIKMAYGDNVGPRDGHSAVLTDDEHIVIYGGSVITNSGNLNVLSDVIVLDTKAWVWDIPIVIKTNAPPPLTFYSTTLYKNYMIIAFGLISSTPNITLNNNIYILDTQNFSWVTTINIPTVANGSTSTVLYIGIAIGVGGVILAVLLFTIIFLFCKKHNELNSAIPTPGDTSVSKKPIPTP